MSGLGNPSSKFYNGSLETRKTFRPRIRSPYSSWIEHLSCTAYMDEESWNWFPGNGAAAITKTNSLSRGISRGNFSVSLSVWVLRSIGPKRFRFARSPWQGLTSGQIHLVGVKRTWKVKRKLSSFNLRITEGHNLKYSLCPSVSFAHFQIYLVTWLQANRLL